MSASSFQLHQGDGLEWMQQLPDGTVDALISDPPYGTTDLFWDGPVDWTRLWHEAGRV